MKKLLVAVIISICATTTNAQETGDTVIVELAKTSRVIFTVKDKSDLEILKHYDFQQLFEDVLKKLEKSDTSSLATRDSTDTSSDVVAENSDSDTDSSDDDDDDDRWSSKHDHHDNGGDYNSDDWTSHYDGRRWGRTWQSFNFDLGTNNYLEDGKFPDSDNKPYSVRPWGSWYVAAGSIQRTRLGSKFFIEWGIGMSWYTFKFQKDNILMVKDNDGVTFVEDTRDVEYEKSKLSASYVQASLVPIVDFGGHGRKARMWDGSNNSFRFGLGPYMAYRITSHSKLVYEEGDDKEKEKNHDSFYLNNFRYGLRLQLGYRSTDLFFNYDLNELFSEGKGPELNAFSFGVIF